MLTVIHTFDGPDKDRVLADIKRGLASVENIDGFKFASVNQQLNSSDLMVMSKWEDRAAFEAWRGTVGDNAAYRQSTPQVFEVIEEKY
ncbi:Antibiotic biosynthesis monooxygenase domain protein [Acididesulfobacillus acetoxydans]|uniref:Antibiotic biosynthesis monooxygenase n=1 Tax=Acididesulfobacillus acetoxydans TaxID=1561005 RepID=A0A8S0WFM0_9FIRM|nr:antibiotic biosynthesis monooxygenase [Acididesulfobacillus acetoxydans]CAA7601172.1 Antibiotic biosynthesis monooxygenase domain protein [Acididesulfobacillus acetoxydans]CEJ08549.1 Antibiotic biosynthesis monooxygenase [Acididesulfobacillus acetoxydans]